MQKNAQSQKLEQDEEIAKLSKSLASEKSKFESQNQVLTQTKKEYEN